MSKYIKSDLLCIGGLEFRFSDIISWPSEGSLSCYHSFLDRPSQPVAVEDVIDVVLKSGQPSLSEERSGVMDSGEGIVWHKSGDAHVVEKVLPHMSPDPLWTIVIHLEKKSAELYFSKEFFEAEEKDGENIVASPRYPLDQHLAMHFLASREGALTHSAGIGFEGKGFMCSGVSGAGKTTISRLFIEDGRFEVLTDDRVINRCSDDTVMMHGTPWTGEGQYATSGVAPLAAMFFLNKDKKIHAERLSVADTVARLLPVTSVPWFDEKLMSGTLMTLEEIARRVPAYILNFTKTSETAQYIAELL